MLVRRFNGLANAFSKKFDNLFHALALYFVFYNFCRKHETLGTTPAVAAGLIGPVHDVAWVVGLIDAVNPPKNRDPPKEMKLKFRHCQKTKQWKKIGLSEECLNCRSAGLTCQKDGSKGGLPSAEINESKGINYLFHNVVPVIGLEPTTPSLRMTCSTS